MVSTGLNIIRKDFDNGYYGEIEILRTVGPEERRTNFEASIESTQYFLKSMFFLKSPENLIESESQELCSFVCLLFVSEITS